MKCASLICATENLNATSVSMSFNPWRDTSPHNLNYTYWFSVMFSKMSYSAVHILLTILLTSTANNITDYYKNANISSLGAEQYPQVKIPTYGPSPSQNIKVYAVFCIWLHQCDWHTSLSFRLSELDLSCRPLGTASAARVCWYRSVCSLSPSGPPCPAAPSGLTPRPPSPGLPPWTPDTPTPAAHTGTEWSSDLVLTRPR